MARPTRRSVLQLSAAAAAYGMIPRKLRSWLAREQSIKPAGLPDPSSLHTYDDGADGAPVLVGDGVVSTAGAPVYSAGAAFHGPLGWLCPVADGGGVLIYANPAPAASSGSLYVTPPEIDDTPVAVVALLADDQPDSVLAAVRLRHDHRIEVVDASAAQLALSAVCWAPNVPLRLDWQQTSTDGTTTITVWAYPGDDVEGWRPHIALTAPLAVSPVGFVRLGSPEGVAAVGFDTYREYDAAVMPPPYAPVVGATAVDTFDAGADGSPVVAGADGLLSTSGHPTYSAAVALHGPLSALIPAEAKGATLTYDVPYPPAHTGSLYVNVAQRGRLDTRIVTLRNDATPLVQIVLRPSGIVCIKDNDGTVLAATAQRSRQGDWTRIDWQATWDGATLAVAVRYTPTNADSFDSWTQIDATVACASTPDTLLVGTAASGWQIYLDTLRTYGDVSAWPPPFDPSPGHAFSLIGDPTSDGATVCSMVLNAQTVDLAVSTTPDMSDPEFAGASAVDTDHLARHTLAGLASSTTHYAQLVASDGTLFGDIVSFTTLPAAGAPLQDLRIALMSCQRSAFPEPPTEVGWINIRDWDPQLLLHGGDFGYWGINLDASDPYQRHLSCYRHQFDRLPVMREVLLSRPSLIQVSDHETSSNNGDNYDDPVTAQALLAYQKLMPTSAYGDTREQIRGRYLAYNLTPNIRLVSLDFRSLDRSPGADPDGPDKTALGADQMAWLHAELVRPEALKIVLSDPAWGPADPPPSPIPYAYLDKWWNYQQAQRAIADIVTGEVTTTGGPINVDLWGNDRHLLGYLAGANNPLGGFPVLCGSGLDQHALPLMTGELYDSVFGFGEVSIPRSQYMRILLSDDGAGQITRSAVAWDCVTDTAQFEAVDTWSY